MLNPGQGRPQICITGARGAGHNDTPRSTTRKAELSAPIRTGSGGNWPPQLLFLCTHAHPAPHLQGRRGRMKRLPGRNAHRWQHPSPARGRCSPRATSRLPHLRGHRLSSLEPGGPPEAHSWRFPLRYPADPVCGRPGEQGREAKGAAERGAAVCCRSPRPDTKRPARPAPPVPTRPAGLGAPPGSDPTSPHKQVSPPWPSRWPRALPIQTPPRRAAAAEAKAGGAAREKPGSRARPLTRAPGAARVPPERCRRPTAGASAGDERAAAGSRGGSE